MLAAPTEGAVRRKINLYGDPCGFKRSLLMSGHRLQDHRRCGKCGKHVRPWKGDRKCDGWVWHKKCWREFLAAYEQSPQA